MFFLGEDFVDRVIDVVDTGVKIAFGDKSAGTPAKEDTGLSEEEQGQSAALMRVNHAGEVCAQGLYEGQALVARSSELRSQLRTAADEEADHLKWCETRLKELRSQPSVLAPVFYGMSVGLGAVVGLAGDRVSLGFVEATEDQVCKHLDRHLDQISPADTRSRTILEHIRSDEERHGTTAKERGGIEFSQPLKQLMTVASKVMTETTRHI